MVFSSTTFLFVFLPAVLLLYFAGRSVGWRNGVLLAASLLFYAWGEGILVGVMLASIVVNYGFSRHITAREGQSGRKWLLAGALIFNLGLLAFFKYANFLIDNLNLLLTAASYPPIYLPKIYLPIGISFFTFQAISYVMDVYWRKIPAQRNVFRLGLYISLFPQLVAGPIVRYTDIRHVLGRRRVKLPQLQSGAERFIIGLAKKVLIADTLGAVVDQIFELPAGTLEWTTAWLGAIAYAFQIYYDFSGYSDMAIGLGLILGFRFPENFTYPYLARSLREFWQRWHISLSTWFRDYLYIPLGGNRRGFARTLFNLGLVFFLCGLWHGASWNFVIWGLFHGAFLMLERSRFGHWLHALPYGLQHIYLCLIVLIGWVFFRADDIGEAGSYLLAMAGHAADPRYYPGLFLSGTVQLALLAGLVFAGPAYLYGRQMAQSRQPWMEFLQLAALLGLFLASLATVVFSDYQPFIYFRF